MFLCLAAHFSRFWANEANSGMAGDSAAEAIHRFEVISGDWGLDGLRPEADESVGETPMLGRSTWLGLPCDQPKSKPVFETEICDF
jgi:hypothetical protein